MRETSKLVIPKHCEDAILEKYCPSCGLHKSAWKRRKDWKCCSTSCTDHFYKHLVIASSWQELRIQVFDRDNRTCCECNKQYSYELLEADHIAPIALGGPQWNKDNLQTLCEKCHKIKTKTDMRNIRNFTTKGERKRMLKDAINCKELRPN